MSRQLGPKRRGRKSGQDVLKGFGKPRAARAPGISEDIRDQLYHNMGPTHDAAALFKQMTPQQARRLARHARARGVSLGEYLRGGPRALQQSTQAGIQRQALQTIKASFAPAEKELDVAQTAAANLRAKEQQDEAYYRNWLTMTQARMQADATQADQAVQQQLAGIRQAEEAQWAGSIDQAAKMPAAAGPQAIGAGIEGYARDRLTDAGRGAQTAARAQDVNTLSRMAQGNVTARAYRDSTIAQEQAAERGSMDNFHETLAKIAEGRTKLGLERGAAAAKEVARLKDQQVDIAGSNRDFGALEQELGIKAADVRRKTTQGNAQLALAYKEYTRKLSKDQVTAALARANLQLKRKDLSRKQRADLERKRHALQQEAQARANEGGRNARAAAARRQRAQLARNGGRGGRGGKPTAGSLKNWGSILNLSAGISGTYSQARGAIARRAHAGGGAPPIAVEAAAVLASGGRLTPAQARNLREAGYNVPRRYVGSRPPH